MSIDDLIAKIEAGRFDESGLINLYNNANKKHDLDEMDKERLVDAIEKNTRLRFPKAAKRIFGAKGSVASNKLGELYDSIIKDLDLSGNQVKNGVKVGGDMIGGRAYICYYMSFKNADNQATGICLFQSSIDTELEVSVTRYSTNNPGTIEHERHVNDMSDFDSMATMYRDYLKELV